MVETLKIEDRRGSIILEEIGAMNDEKQTLVAHIQSLKRQEKEKSGQQYTQAQWLSDENTWVNFITSYSMSSSLFVSLGKTPTLRSILF